MHWVYNSIARVAPLYDLIASLVGYRRAVDSFVARIPLNTASSFTALDAGCGTGPYTLSILKRFPYARVYAFDINSGLANRLEHILKKSKSDTRARVFVADLSGDLKELSKHEFDLIVTAGTLEYLHIESTVIKLTNLLKPGGYFVNSPIKDNPLGRLIGALYGCKPYAVEKNIAAVKESGLTLRERYVPGVLNFKEFHLFQKEL